MPDDFRVDMRQENGRMHIVLSGAFAPVVGRAHYDCVTREAEARGLRRILLDARALRGRASIPEIFDFILRTYPERPGGRRTACVDLPEHQLSARFVEHMMQNNGRCYRLFFNEEEALEWLESDRP